MLLTAGELGWAAEQHWFGAQQPGSPFLPPKKGFGLLPRTQQQAGVCSSVSPVPAAPPHSVRSCPLPGQPKPQQLPWAAGAWEVLLKERSSNWSEPMAIQVIRRETKKQPLLLSQGMVWPRAIFAWHYQAQWWSSHPVSVFSTRNGRLSLLPPPAVRELGPSKGLEESIQLRHRAWHTSVEGSAFALWPSQVLFPRPASGCLGNYLWTGAELLQLKEVTVDRCQCNK